MNKKWLCIGFVFICLVMLGVGFQAGRQYGYQEGWGDFEPRVIQEQVPVNHYSEEVIFVILPYETIKETVITEYVDADLSAVSYTHLTLPTTPYV